MRCARAASRALFLAAVLAAAAYHAEALQQAPPDGGRPPPIFRGGTTLVQVDAIVGDDTGRPTVDLGAADFDALDGGRRVPLERVRFLGATAYGGDATLAPIRTHDDEERRG